MGSCIAIWYCGRLLWGKLKDVNVSLRLQKAALRQVLIWSIASLFSGGLRCLPSTDSTYIYSSIVHVRKISQEPHLTRGKFTSTKPEGRTLLTSPITVCQGLCAVFQEWPGNFSTSCLLNWKPCTQRVLPGLWGSRPCCRRPLLFCGIILWRQHLGVFVLVLHQSVRHWNNLRNVNIGLCYV